MPLHLTKVAFGCETLNVLSDRVAMRVSEGRMTLTTRYLPKRHAEIAGGSLFWIIKHKLVARSPILRFGEADAGRVAIELEPRLIVVSARPKRAHQGWRYLEGADAPADLDEAAEGALPPRLLGELAALGLL